MSSRAEREGEGGGKGFQLPKWECGEFEEGDRASLSGCIATQSALPALRVCV